MAINERLSQLLAQHRIQPEVLTHREAFTAQEVAQSTHVPGRKLAKAVLLRDSSSSYLMAVVPATKHVDLHAIRDLTGRRGLRLANEEEMRHVFPDCEAGAMPPFGPLYGIAMLVDPCLEGGDLYFQAGNHHEVVRMSFEVFARVAGPFSAKECLHAEHADVTG